MTLRGFGKGLAVKLVCLATIVSFSPECCLASSFATGLNGSPGSVDDDGATKEGRTENYERFWSGTYDRERLTMAAPRPMASYSFMGEKRNAHINFPRSPSGVASPLKSFRILDESEAFERVGGDTTTGVILLLGGLAVIAGSLWMMTGSVEAHDEGGDSSGNPLFVPGLVVGAGGLGLSIWGIIELAD